MIYTTLNHIRGHNPCAAGWRKLLAHLGKNDPYAPLAYSTIIESNGLDDALWCLRAEPQHSSIWRMFAVRCARRVQHLMADERSLQSLDVAERYARGAATDSELAAARDTVRDAARATGWGTACAATWDAANDTAWDAARDTAWDTAWVATWDTIRADFERMLAAHHAMPGDSCALVEWWIGGEQ